MSLFRTVKLAPRDPILGLNEAFNADTRPNKVNLGVGVYTDDTGRLPLLKAVRQAEQARAASEPPRGYLPIQGSAAYNAAVQALLFGPHSPLIAAGQIATVQTLGGTGALRIGADFLKQLNPNAKVAISDPSWENHRALFEAAGFEVAAYPYYDAATHGVNFSGMIDALNGYPAGTIIVLHACCHNPTGVDLSVDQWGRIVAMIRERQLVPFLDIAYQGFDQGIDADAQAVRQFAEAGIETLIANSFSKSFSLYGERVGALSGITLDSDHATRVLSQLKRVIRANYSSPPTHGGAVITDVLNSTELRALWEQELGEMRTRIRAMRHTLAAKLKEYGAQLGSGDFEFIKQQRGMFSYSGLSASQAEQLKNAFGIYVVGTGRICVAALNPQNIDYVARGIAEVLNSSPSVE